MDMLEHMQEHRLLRFESVSLGQKKHMAIKTLFLPLQMAETKTQENSKTDKYDKHETKEKAFDSRQMSQLTVRTNSELSKLNTYLNAFNLKTNIEGGYSIVSVTPVLGSKVEKVDADEPMVSMVSTTGFLVILHKAGDGIGFPE